MKSKIILFCILLFSICLLGVNQISAEDISFSAEVNTNRVPLGSVFQLTLTINGVTNIGDMNLPQFDGFDVKYIGPSTHVSIINGKYYSSKSFTYAIKPLKAGRFIIQPLNITIKGKNYLTQQIEIEVYDSSGPVSQAMAGTQGSLKEKINLVLRVPKKEVYLNEALPVKIMLLVNESGKRTIRVCNYWTLSGLWKS